MYGALWNSSWIYHSDKYSVSLYVILYYTCKRLCSVLKCFLHSMRQLEIGIMLVLWLCIFFGPDLTEGIKFGPPDRTRYLYSKVNVHSLAISYLRKFRHLYLINLQMDRPDTRTGPISSYKEKFSSKEAAELATLQFNPFPCVYISKASLAKLCTSS